MKDSKDILFPHSRQEVFFDLLRHHKWEIEKGNLWGLLFAAPSLLLAYLYWLFAGFLPQMVKDGTWVLPTLEDGTAISESLYLFQVRNVFSVVFLFTNVLLFLGLGGLYGLLQKLIFAEPFDELRGVYFAGLKKNAKQFIALSLVFSVVAEFFNLIVSYYSNDLSSPISIVSIVIAAIVLLALLIFLFLGLPLSNLYRISFGALFKDSFIFFAVKILRNLGLFLLAYLPLLLLALPSLYFQMIYSFALLLVYPPYFALLGILEMNSEADDLINPTRFPELIRKGLDAPSSKKD
jgi:hypothetical protein